MVRKDYEKLFTNLTPKEPPAGLLRRIMLRIDEEERLMSIKRQFVLFSSSFVVSAIAFILVLNIIRADFGQSEFYQFFSLLFSDSGLVMQHWQDFGLALLESVPVISIAILLGTFLVFLWSLKHLAKAAKVVFNQPLFISPTFLLVKNLHESKSVSRNYYCTCWPPHPWRLFGNWHGEQG